MRLPAIGFGCSPFRAGGRRVDLAAAVRSAASMGYRLFDVAELYGNERAVGAALRESGVRRDDLVLVGKVWRTNFRPDRLRTACEASLLRLGITSFDAYLLHAPEAWEHAGMLDEGDEIGWDELERRAVPRDATGAPRRDAVPLAETWQALWALREAGLVRHVGVSNFDERALEPLDPSPELDEILRTPRRPAWALLAACRARRTAVLVHSPLSAPGAADDPAVVRLAAAAGTTAADLLLRWHVACSTVPLPSSTVEAHLRANLDAATRPLDAGLSAALARLAEPSADLTLGESAP